MSHPPTKREVLSSRANVRGVLKISVVLQTEKDLRGPGSGVIMQAKKDMYAFKKGKHLNVIKISGGRSNMRGGVIATYLVNDKGVPF